MEDMELIGRPVRSLQTMLRAIARCDRQLPQVIPDGIYGPKTQAAVAAFQRREGLPQTGVTDFATWKAVCAAFHNARIRLSPAAPVQIVMQPGQVFLEGSDNRNVLLVQAMLHNLHEVYPNLPDCTMCGVCERTTSAAISALQQLCGAQPSGILDKELWQMLCGLYTQAVGDGERTR